MADEHPRTSSPGDEPQERDDHRLEASDPLADAFGRGAPEAVEGLETQALHRSAADASSEADDDPYTTQYRETDLDFVGRLTEDEGIAYHFVHDDTEHTLVLADSDDDEGQDDPLDE